MDAGAYWEGCKFMNILIDTNAMFHRIDPKTGTSEAN